jgi:biopolymer transport protein ExbB
MDRIMFANVVVEWFVDGGPIMWPLAIVALVMLGVIAERCVFWAMLKRRHDPGALEQTLAAMENLDFVGALRVARQSDDPVLRMIYQGLTHVHGSLAGALQVAAGMEIRRAGRSIVLVDTCITLAPLLGLLGTVTGIMKAFREVVGELAVQAVSAGIGEALIATAAGLAIAIVGVFFLNLFNELLAKLQFDMETAATSVEVLVTKARQEGLDLGSLKEDARPGGRPDAVS